MARDLSFLACLAATKELGSSAPDFKEAGNGCFTFLIALL